MATYKFFQGDDWSVIIPTYRMLDNYDLWLTQAAPTSEITDYFAAFEVWRAANDNGPEEAFLASIFTTGLPNRQALIDLTGYTLRYQIRADASLIAVPVLFTTVTARDGVTQLDLLQHGRFGLSMNDLQTTEIAAGNYKGELEITKDGVTETFPSDEIIVNEEVTK